MKTPRLADRLINRLINHVYLDEILGDLQEEYQSNINQKGKTRATLKYWQSTIRFINTRTLKRTTSLNNTAMLKNYILIALRNIARQKVYSVINIVGLALGIACSLLLMLYVINELSYDKFHDNATRIVRASTEYEYDGEVDKSYYTPTALLPALQDLFPEVKTGVRLFYPANFRAPIISFGQKTFAEPGFCYADSTFFEMFSFSLLEGNATTVLDEPNNIVLTKTSERKYFGDASAMNQTLIVQGKAFKVTGIVEDVPANSTIQFDFVASFSSFWQRKPIWGSANYDTYIELNQLIAPKLLSTKIQEHLQSLGMSDPENGEYFGFVFEPLLDLHLHSEIKSGGGSITNLYIFGSIALLILIIAIINYTNLTIARAFYRAKEVGLRKTLGAQKSSVFLQLMGESFVTVFLAMIFAVGIGFLMLPLFSEVSGASLNFSLFYQPIVLWGFVLVYLLIAFVAGVYPATKMAKFTPVETLKGRYQGSSQGAFLRKSLIVMQFFISLSLIIAMLVAYNQLSFINNKELGYEKENVLVFPISKAVNKKAAAFKSMILQNPNIRAVAIGGETPPNIEGGYSISLANEESLGVTAVAIDEAYLEANTIRLLAGRSISLTDLQRTREIDQHSFLINETAARKLGWTTEEAVCQKLLMNGRQGFVEGVVQDFHFRALYEKVSPLVLFTEETWAYNYVMVRIDGAHTAEAIASVETSWKSIDEASPISISFLDQEFASLHENSSRFGTMLSVSSALAILIASLGLFGIVSFSMAQRAKEIGVRKVLGASVSNVLVLANKEFLMPILIAFVLAIPTTYWLMNQWLSSFAYHINIGVLPMILGLLFTLIIAVVTISFESLKAALVNPVETLRNE